MFFLYYSPWFLFLLCIQYGFQKAVNDNINRIWFLHLHCWCFWVKNTQAGLPYFHFPIFTSRVSLPEFRFGITGNRRFSGSCTASATARGPFRFAQEDYLMGLAWVELKRTNLGVIAVIFAQESQKGLDYKFSDPCNLIHYNESFLSRSTRESGLTKWRRFPSFYSFYFLFDWYQTGWRRNPVSCGLNSISRG